MGSLAPRPTLLLSHPGLGTRQWRRTYIECIGYKKKARKEWITDNTWKSIEERKKLKTKILETKSPRLKERITKEYREKEKEIKTSARRDKRNRIEKPAEKAEEAANKGDIATLYKITRSLSGKKINQELPVKAADGTPITEEKAKLERWKKHFEQILNRPVPPDLSNITEAKEDLDINLDR